MRRMLLAVLGIAALTGGCRSSSPDGPAAAGPAASTAVNRPEPKKFGKRITSSEAVPLARVLERPTEFQGRQLVVDGHVRRACSRKGCWMELATGPEESLPGCRVTFKDYGFFVPTDSHGASARVEASVKVSTVSAPSVRHLEEEGAQFAQKNPDGTAQEVRLVATGVELWR